MSFVVHSIPGSPFGRTVLATLEEKGVDYRFAPVTPPAHRGEEHRARHPFGRVPAIEHDGFGLYETSAIVRYIDRAFDGPALTPADARSAARMDQAMSVSDWYLFQGVGNVIGFQRVVRPILMGQPADEAACAAAMPQARIVVAALEAMLADGPYFAGESISLADLMIAPQLDFMAQSPEWAELGPAAPRLDAWLARINVRQSLQATTWEKVGLMAKAA
ncbi:MAG TPA: glutathione S-transferase family protein [Caulobacteraceae bacterium]|jgi:glutathione S-transferase|nr:glutathione S-transferase family protein [Caulobacteraceae bacterium]